MKIVLKISLMLLFTAIMCFADSFLLKEAERINASGKYTKYQLNDVQGIAYDLNSIAKNLANKLVSANTLKKNKYIAIASFVNIKNFKDSYDIGTIIGENMIFEIQSLGYSVVDYKMMNKINVSKSGDFVFTRDVRMLKEYQEVDYFLSGTITKNSNGYVINARVIDTKNNLVVASAQEILNGVTYFE